MVADSLPPPRIPEVGAGERGSKELGVMGFVSEVVLFCFCLLNVPRARYSFEYQLLKYLCIDVAGVPGDKV